MWGGVGQTSYLLHILQLSTSAALIKMNGLLFFISWLGLPLYMKESIAFKAVCRVTESSEWFG